MNRLEKLKFEREIAKKLKLLPFHMIPIVDGYYQKEIDAIEKYNAANPHVADDSLSEIEKIMEKAYGNQKAE